MNEKKARPQFNIAALPSLFIHLFTLVCLGLVLEEVLYGLIGNHLLVKDVSTSLGALYHLDNFCVCATILRAFMEGSNGFLCHSFTFLLFNLFTLT